MNDWLSDAANASIIAYAVFTMLLFAVAICAAVYAKKNIDILKKDVEVSREQNRRNLFLRLMVDVASTEARRHRAILHKIYLKVKEREYENRVFN